MTREIMTVAPDAPIMRVVEPLLDKLFKAVPVIEDTRHVVSIMTENDLLSRSGMPARLAVAGNG